MSRRSTSRKAVTSVRRFVARRPRTFVSAVGAVSLAGWLAAAAGAWFLFDVTRGLPGREEIGTIGQMAQATTVYDHRDAPVFVIFTEQRIEVSLADVAPRLIQAILAIEDQRFYDHRGFDPTRILGAALANLRQGRVVQGGSTITQQLARQSFLTRDRTLRRKLQEVLLSVRLERAYSKDEIFELYLNKVYFGDGLYGVEAAARGFFGKSASEVDTSEAAMLAGLIQAPSLYAPTIDLDRAVARRAVVLQAMLDAGVIDTGELESSRDARVVLRNGLRREERFGGYFKELVRLELVERFGWQQVHEGGLRVYTTIDADAQQAAEAAVEQTLRRIEARSDYRHVARPVDGASPDADYLQGALVAMDPRTGHVRALVGGRSFADSPFNRATQARRQSGSAFKPFVYAAALEAGLTPATLIAGLHDPILTPQGPWIPEDGQTDAQALTARTALRTSSNRAAVRLLQTVGIARVVDQAERFHVGGQPAVASLALGSGEVTLQTLTAAYGAFAAGGIVHRPVLVRRVEDRSGLVLHDAQPAGEQAVTPTTAFLVASMLADVIDGGTAARVRTDGFRLPAAGKTGTTNDYVDAWFVGFTPSLVAGVWVGFDRPRSIVRSGYAAQLAVPVWSAFMKDATRGQRPEWIERPRDVVSVDVCRLSGRRPADGCHRVEVVDQHGAIASRSLIYTEYFRLGTQPDETCDLHPGRSMLDRLAGLFGAGREAPPPIPASAAGLPQVAATPDAPAGEMGQDAAVEEAPRRRGFWSRLFGRGRD